MKNEYFDKNVIMLTVFLCTVMINNMQDKNVFYTSCCSLRGIR